MIVAGAALGVSGKAIAGRPTIAPGLQLYTLSNVIGEDCSAVLAEIGRMGYREVELPPVFTSASADRRLIYRARADWPFIKGVLRDSGLRCRSVHVLPQRLPGLDLPTLETHLSEQIEFAHYIGASYLVCALYYIPPRLQSALSSFGEEAVSNLLLLDDWRAAADFLSRISRELRRSGLTLAYHNHHLELKRFGDVVALDELLVHADPDVKLEMDCGHLASAGHDPVRFLQRYPGRIPLLHVKDISAPGASIYDTTASVEIGSGIIDWHALFRAAREAGVVQYYVEQDGPFARPVLESVRTSYDYLRSING